MQAIVTKYLPATATRGSRIKASCERGSITIDYPHELSGDAVHIAAADALVAKFVKEDVKRYGTNRNPWQSARVCGEIKGVGRVHVFSGISGNPLVISFGDEEDRANFSRCLERAQKTGGTISPLWCGILSAILKRCKI